MLNLLVDGIHVKLGQRRRTAGGDFPGIDLRRKGVEVDVVGSWNFRALSVEDWFEYKEQYSGDRLRARRVRRIAQPGRVSR